MENKNKKTIKIVIILLSVTALAIAYYELKLLDISIGIYKLEIEGKKIAKVSKKSLIYIMKSKEPKEVFMDKMDSLGWKYYDSYGRGYLFTKDGEEILAIKSSYFGRYTVYEIHNDKYFTYINREE